MPREEIDALAQGKTHGGLLAVCSEREYQNLEDIVQKPDLFLALIEGVEDPFNFGYILRTLYAAGCDGVIIPPRNWTSAADVVTKSSAGASEYINLFLAENMEETLQLLKNIKFQSYVDKEAMLFLYTNIVSHKKYVLRLVEKCED